MATEHRVISADSHVNPPPTIYQEYTSPEFRDRAPRVEIRGDQQVMLFEGRETIASGLSSVAGKKYEDFKHQVKTFEEGRRGGFDPHARIEDMDLDNVGAEVLYGGTITLQTDDRDLRVALMRAYNDWLANFCKTHPDRLVGIGEIPTYDIDLAVAEATRVRKAGLRGVLIPAIPGLEGSWSTPADRPYTDPWYDPLWSALQDLDLPAHMHLGARPLTNGLASNIIVSVTCNKAMMMEPIASLIVSGVLERHPKLKVVSVESGIGWMAFTVPWLDKVWEKHRHWTGNPLKEAPSFYFHRQVLGTFIEDEVGVRERHTIGVSNIMWSNDYPHSDSTWPHSQQAIEEHFADVPEDEKRQITEGNAASLYGL
ncbi:amidohydrolase [Dehalococcoidia bacterium]|nr:amidohydrolase [Dehalococcoidia bacterium]